MTCLGPITLDPVGEMLGTGYARFVSPLGVDGLCQVRSPRLDLLAVASARPGTGQFRAFIAQAKREFTTICVWQVGNDFLPSVLLRYGFVPTEDIWENELLAGFRWNKPQ